MEDFAHHPTALAEMLTSFRNRFSGRHIVACFEPRSNTATTNVFQEGFTDALAHANEVLLGAVHRGENIVAEERLDTSKIVADLEARGLVAHAFTQNADLLTHLQGRFDPQSGDPVLVCFFSNGGFDGVPASFARGLQIAVPA